MQNNLITKIAVGVFLGIAAWTNRAELGNIAFYALVVVIAFVVIVYVYRSITTPIKNLINEHQIDALVVELHKNGFLKDQLTGAAREGLNRFYYEATRRELAELLNLVKIKRSHEQLCDVEEQRIDKLLLEIIEDFKHRYRQS